MPKIQHYESSNDLQEQIKRNKSARSIDIKILKSHEINHSEIQNFLSKNRISVHPELRLLMDL